MNDSFDAFELQLRRLKPAPPPANLQPRVATALAAAPAPIPDRVPAWRAFLDRLLGPSYSPAWTLAAAAVLVAAVSAAVLLPSTRTATAPAAGAAPGGASPDVASASTAPSGPRLTRAATVSQAVYDDGLVRDANGAMTQQVRYQFTDTLAWRDDQTGTEVVVSFPRMEVVSSPVRAF
jgi:hypothetical protein